MLQQTAAAPHWLAANPAVELMSRLSYPKKIQTIGLIAGMAILLLTGQLFFSLAGQIGRASLERTGLLLVQPLRAVIEPLQQHRGLANAWASADEGFRVEHEKLLLSALRERERQIDSAIAAAETNFRSDMPALSDDPRWLATQRLWREIKANGYIDQMHVLEQHNEMIVKLTALISSAADATHLSVDPYVGTFYLAQLVVRQMPTLIEQTSKIRDIGAGIYASRELLRDDKNLIISLNTMTGSVIEEVRDVINEKVLTTMPALEKELAGDVERLTGIGEAVDTFTQFKLLGKLFDSPPQAFFAGMTWSESARLDAFGVVKRDLSLDSGQAIAAGPIGQMYAALDHYTKLLDTSIENRLWNLYQQLALNLLVSLGALVVVIYMLYVMYVSFPIRKLIAATEEVAGGNLDVHMEIERNDEIGQLARAFNTMTEAVRFNRDNLERLVSDRTADLADKNHLIMESINYARVIQSSFLRASRQDMASSLADYFMIWDPRDTVGGDYLYFRRFDNGYFFAVIDCTGHGVPGAFMTLIMASYLNNLLTADNRHDPAALLGRMNRSVKQALGQIEGKAHTEHDDHHDEGHRSDDGMDAAFGWVDTTTHTLTYAGAKTPLFYLHPGDAEVQTLDGPRTGVGYTDTPLDFCWENRELALQPGTAIYVTTDGIIDQVGEVKRISYGKRRLHKTILAARNLPMSAQQDEIREPFLEHQGNQPRRDDVSM
ncbi:MAG: SpoIIE family protein phosphatase, partial [Rhodocyclaceae bacterium]